MGDIVDFPRRVLGQVEFSAEECTCGCQEFMLRNPDRGALSELFVAVCADCEMVLPDVVFTRLVAEGIHKLYEEGLNGEG